jgi:hypothetical protein
VRKVFDESTRIIIEAALKPILATLAEHSGRIAFLEGVIQGKQLLVDETKLTSRSETGRRGDE